MLEERLATDCRRELIRDVVKEKVYLRRILWQPWPNFGSSFVERAAQRLQRWKELGDLLCGQPEFSDQLLLFVRIADREALARNVRDTLFDTSDRLFAFDLWLAHLEVVVPCFGRALDFVGLGLACCADCTFALRAFPVVGVGAIVQKVAIQQAIRIQGVEHKREWHFVDLFVVLIFVFVFFVNFVCASDRYTFGSFSYYDKTGNESSR